MKEFGFVECIEIKELLGKRADNELDLLELLEDVPADSIYYHTHSYFLRHFYLTGEYPNDFANWAVIQLRDRVLGEKLGSVTPEATKTLENIRTEVMDIIDNHLAEVKSVPFVSQGEPFYFMKSRIIEVPTGIEVSNLREFVEALKKIHASAIYYHIFEAAFRSKRGRNDFAIWCEQCLGLKELSAAIDHVDFYMYSLEGLRKKIVFLCEEEIRRIDVG